jgi:hypothetical protein
MYGPLWTSSVRRTGVVIDAGRGVEHDIKRLTVAFNVPYG